jgi:hypothetical protein
MTDESHSWPAATGVWDSKDLSHLITSEEWAIISPALESMKLRGLQFAMGGGFAYSAYSEHCRTTKDIDLFIRPEDRQGFIDALTGAGFDDYFDQKEYDRSWIYRGYRDGAIIDVIWQMANHRALVEESWLSGGRTVWIHGMQLSVLPLEELFWAKLYVLQRDRCDWPDLLNLLYSVSDQIDWDRLLDRVGRDCELVGSVAALFRWMCPDKAGNIPDWVYLRLGLWPEAPECAKPTSEEPDRPTMLDSRAWFA